MLLHHCICVLDCRCICTNCVSPKCLARLARSDSIAVRCVSNRCEFCMSIILRLVLWRGNIYIFVTICTDTVISWLTDQCWNWLNRVAPSRIFSREQIQHFWSYPTRGLAFRGHKNCWRLRLCPKIEGCTQHAIRTSSWMEGTALRCRASEFTSLGGNGNPALQW